MAGLRDRLRDDLHDAMRARDVVRRDTIRLLEAAVKNAEIEARGPLDEPVLLTVIQRQIKQRHEAIDQYRSAGRDDRADKEAAELAVLEGYLPAQMDRDAIAEAARALIARLGAAGPRDKGKIMGPLMGELRGKADGRLVNAVVTELLAE